MHDAGEGIDGLAVEEEVQADQVRRAFPRLLVVEAGVAAGKRFELVVKARPQLCQGQRVPGRGFMYVHMVINKHTTV